MLEISDALSFFRLSCGRWTSQRSQHHLLHRRAEAGASFIVVEELLKGDERLAEIAERNNASVEQIVGGCWVRCEVQRPQLRRKKLRASEISSIAGVEEVG